MPQLTEIDVLTYYSSVVCGLLQPGSSSLTSVPKVASRQDVGDDVNMKSPQNVIDNNVRKKEKKSKGKRGNQNMTQAVEPGVKPVEEAVIAVVEPKDKERQSKRGKKRSLNASLSITEDLEQNLPAPDDKKKQKQSKSLPKNATSGQTEAVQTPAHQAQPQPRSTDAMFSAIASKGDKKSARRKKQDQAAAVLEVLHKGTSKGADKEGTKEQTPAKAKPRKSKGKEKDVAAIAKETEPAEEVTENDKEPAKAKTRKSKGKDNPVPPRIPVAITDPGTSNALASSSTPSKTVITASVPGSHASPKSTTPPPSLSRAPSTPVSEEDVLRHLYTRLSNGSGPFAASLSAPSASEIRKRRRESMVETPLRHKVLLRPSESLGKKRRMSVANENVDLHEEGEDTMEEIDMLASPAFPTAPAAGKKDKKDKKGKVPAPPHKAPSDLALTPVPDDPTELPIFSELRRKDKKKTKEKKEEKQKKDRKEKEKQEREKSETREKNEAKEKGKEKEHGKGRKRKGEALQAETSGPAVAPATIPASAPAPAPAPIPVSPAASISTPAPNQKTPTSSTSKKKRRLTEIPIPRLSPSIKSPAGTTSAASPASSKKTKLSQGLIPLGNSLDTAKMHMYASMGIVTPSPSSKGSSKKEKKIGKKGPKWITETPRM